MDISFSFQDLILAYRKAKVDIFYSNIENYSPLLKYEQNLEENLKNLCKRLKIYKTEYNTNSSLEPFFPNINNPSSYSLMGKSYENDMLTLRIFSNFLIEFHVIASLWILKIGAKIDADFDDSKVWGNRVRLCEDRTVNPNALGNLKPYSYQYSHWQRNAIKTIEDSLHSGIDVSVYSFDAKAYFHSINPNVLKDSGLDIYTKGFEWLHTIVSDAIILWSSKPKAIFFEEIEWQGSHIGMPIGLSVTCIIANWVLSKLDNEIVNAINPLYYGRYVDDILLIVPLRKDADQTEFVSWLCKSIRSLKLKKQQDTKLLTYSWKSSSKEKNALSFDIYFGQEKAQYQEFAGVLGEAKLAVFKQQLDERTSEWRALPELPVSNKAILDKLLEVKDKNKIPSQTLGAFNEISVIKSRFTFMLRDLEACLRIFPPQAWKQQRVSFLKAFTTYILNEKEFFNYEKYLQRVLSLGLLCLDYEAVAEILDRFESLMDRLNESQAKISLAGDNGHNIDLKDSNCFSFYRHVIQTNIKDLILRSNPNFDRAKFKSKFATDSRSISYIDETSDKKTWKNYFLHDLAIFPFKYSKMHNFNNPMVLYDIDKNINKTEFKSLDEDLANITEMTYSDSEISNEDFFPYIFSTRPFSASDLAFYHTDPCRVYNYNINSDESEEMITWSEKNIFKPLENLRGYRVGEKPGSLFFGKNILTVPTDYKHSEIPFAIACWKMNESEITDHLKGVTPFSSLTARYQRFAKLLNQVMSSPIPIRYVIFPELAIPPNWFITAAKKLQKKNICLISGISYLPVNTNTNKMTNEIWASLDSNIFDFSTHFIYRQQKQFPAMGEKERLARVNNIIFSPETPQKDWPPVIQHGDLFFSMLVCSELLNISLRSELRGKIDTLIASEWNRDINTFNALVEASAMDLHAYIVQCNNNVYGDCRIRAPYKEEYLRDIVKSKGGENDYFLVGKIKIDELREFQSDTVPNEKNTIFKPFPVGFEMSLARRENWEKRKRGLT